MIIGVHIIGPHAGELIAEAGVAIEKKTTAMELGNLCHLRYQKRSKKPL